VIGWCITKVSTRLATQSRARKKSKAGAARKKNDLVRTLNPLWRDLGEELFERER
jgi:hypothetical protein